MSYVLTSTSDAEGKLHLEIPVSQPDLEFEVEVSVRPKPAVNGAVTKPIDPWARINAFRERLAATGIKFSDSVDLIREDRDR
ncbi:MAG: hypothetical protein JNJ77_13365 [Planctomycetia bacterium]|nr:hypothetical protein [Planctomycetia bacterium]